MVFILGHKYEVFILSHLSATLTRPSRELHDLEEVPMVDLDSSVDSWFEPRRGWSQWMVSLFGGVHSTTQLIRSSFCTLVRGVHSDPE